MKKMHLSIPQPCHEDWNEMTPNERGRFCQSCQKTVVDFTAMSDVEVLNFFKQKAGKVCGQFRQEQVDKTYSPPQKQWTPQWVKAGLLASGLLTAAGLDAQPTVTKEKMAVPANVKQEKMMIRGTATDSSLDGITIRGKVTEKDSGEPILFGAVVLLDKQGEVATAVETDFDGNYELEIPPNLIDDKEWRIEYQYIGAKTREIVVKNKGVAFILQNAAIVFNNDMMGEVVLLRPYAYGKDNTVGQYLHQWGRSVYHSIRDWVSMRKKAKRQQLIQSASPSPTSAIPAFRQINGQMKKTTTLIYPNPFTDYLQIAYPATEGKDIQIKIIDINGRIVFSQQYRVEQGENNINLTPDLISGNYWLRIESAGEEAEVLAISRITKN